MNRPLMWSECIQRTCLQSIATYKDTVLFCWPEKSIRQPAFSNLSYHHQFSNSPSKKKIFMLLLYACLLPQKWYVIFVYQDYIVKRLQQEDDQIAQVYIFLFKHLPIYSVKIQIRTTSITTSITTSVSSIFYSSRCLEIGRSPPTRMWNIT